MAQYTFLMSLLSLLVALLAVAMSVRSWLAERRSHAKDLADAVAMRAVAPQLGAAIAESTEKLGESLATLQSISMRHETVAEMHGSAARAYLNEVTARRA